MGGGRVLRTTDESRMRFQTKVALERQRNSGNEERNLLQRIPHGVQGKQEATHSVFMKEGELDVVDAPETTSSNLNVQQFMGDTNVDRNLEPAPRLYRDEGKNNFG